MAAVLKAAKRDDAVSPRLASSAIEDARFNPLTRQDSSRLELQASCLGDVFMSANATAYPIAPEYLAPEWERYWRIISIDTLHGTEDNQRYWTHRGFDQRSPRACNTWKASRTSTA